MPSSPLATVEMLTQILDSLNVGVVFIDPENRIAFVNKEAEKIRQMKSEESVGTSILKCHRETMHKRVTEMIDAFRAGIKATRHKMVRSRGRWFDNTYNVVTREEGNYCGTVLVSQDVTEKLLLEQRLLKANEELEEKVKNRTAEIEEAYNELRRAQQQLMQTEKMVSIGQFVAGVAHEINNPLDGVQNCIRAALEAIPEGERPHHYLSMSLEGLYKIELLVRQLLDYARPHAYELTALNLNDVLTDVLHLTQLKLNQKGIRTSVDLAWDMPPISGDSHYLQQVFINIILNAFDALERDGELCVRTRQDDDDGVIVTIEDDGCGIPPEHLSKIFDPFFSTKGDRSGTGLGLYLSYNVVSHHGGRITVSSELGRGTRFTLWFPFIQEHSQAHQGNGHGEQRSL